MSARRIEAPPAPPTVRPENDPAQTVATALLTICAATVAFAPGAIVGAILAGACWQARRSSHLWRWTIASLLLAATAVFRPDIEWGWLWRLLESNFLRHGAQPPAPAATLRSVVVEATAGPLVYLLAAQARQIRQRSLGAHLRRRYDREMSRSDALSRDLKRGVRGVQSPDGATAAGGMAHPPGVVRLGVNAERNEVFDLALSELTQHVFIPGASGSGKSTTIARIADGVVAAGWTVAIIDCKGTGLTATARQLAARYGIPLTLLDPGDSKTAGYNPCSGTGPAVSNKLVGSFEWGADAQIYANVASNALSVTVKAMHAAGQTVTLDSLIDVLGTAGALEDLADSGGSAVERYGAELKRLGTAGSATTTKKGVDGMVERLRVLQSGEFGAIFEAEPVLDWDEATKTQSVIFFALSATAAANDVHLMGRVLLQDLKQLCDRRLRRITQNNEDLPPMLVIFDEFATLSDADQVVDLLLQARQARVSVVLATQVLPDEPMIRKPALQSGVLIVHRLETDDANVLAAQLGTRKVPEHTWAPAQSEGETDRLSVRMVDEFLLHPNTVRQLTVSGRVAIRSVSTNRNAILQIFRPPDSKL
jgi:hypothetical protein